MYRNVLIVLIVVLLSGAMVFACANKEEDSEPGAIETFTEKTADEITTSIKTPINKARSAKDTSQNRMKDVDGMAKE